MKYILLITLLMFCVIGKTQTNDSVITFQSSFLDTFEIHCSVDHQFGDNHFTCDYKGNYYPFYIADSAIKRWFVKMDKGDSLFYYRHPDWITIFRWDKELKCYAADRGMIWLMVGYQGDSLMIKDQRWESIKPEN